MIFDSFPELAVQKFTPANSVCTLYSYFSLIKEKAISTGALTTYGLLAIEKIKAEYPRFFECISRYYQIMRIISLHSPLKYEQREIFLERLTAIHNTIKILKMQFSNLAVLDTPEKFVLPRPGDPSAFHFAALTYQYIGQHIKITI